MSAVALINKLDNTPKRADRVQLVSEAIREKMADMQALMDCINANGGVCAQCIRQSYCERRKRAV